MQIPISIRDSINGINLNFTIIGSTTQPLNPKENIIWINTDQEITEWIFSTMQPDNPIDGMVWIKLVDEVLLDGFNAVTDEEYIVRYSRIEQYLSGVWTKKESSMYINGKWIDNVVKLFDKGEEFTDITGGWVALGFNNEPSFWGTYTGGFSKPTGYLRTNVPTTSGDLWCTGGTAIPIDLTEFSILEVDIASFIDGSDVGDNRISIIGNMSSWVASWCIATTGTIQFDISAISGSYYITLMSHGQNIPMQLTVSGVRLLP